MQQASYHHGNLRSSLVNMGAELLNDRGISGISLREIARRVGVGHNAPYRHFRNKQQLLEAIAEDGYRKLKARNTRLELEFAHDPEAQLFESSMHIVSMASEQPNLFQLMFGGSLKPEECPGSLKEEADEAMQSLVRIIRNGQKLHVFVEGEPMKLAMSAMSMVQGLALMVSSGTFRLQPAPGLVVSSAASQTLLRGVVLQLFDVFMRGVKVGVG
ncbi:hypothetical protein MNBD_GAMMA11-454 [hydrothermal vent metagenome]|uniref:HTH tetR-type domain-containing protein n=1 Tax=hydrothermal vent metagenome TaxID=652676 RepID=A0A3B0X7E1_9ZZZZ